MVETDSDKNYHKNGGNLQKGKDPSLLEKVLTINEGFPSGLLLKHILKNVQFSTFLTLPVSFWVYGSCGQTAFIIM